MTGFLLFPGVLEGLGSSGRLTGSVSTYPGSMCKCLGKQVMAKKLGGELCSSVHGLSESVVQNLEILHPRAKIEITKHENAE